MIALLPLLLLLQQPTQTVSPPSGDTVGYWQQRADYRITAELDEKVETLHGKATLTYVNNSPDTLKQMYVQQLLNAFRPGSRWSAADEREGRVRFQKLKEPNYGFERFTSAPKVNGARVTAEYPFAPDSTIARFELPVALAPGDTAIVEFAWDARPSATVYRRQGRRGRHYDFSQWYPKVAVYDRGGWEIQPFIPNGEMYGEFGTFDVTLILAKDQVVGATGIPVAGDPGWEKAREWGEVHLSRDAYGVVDTTLPPTLPAGDKAVRFLARNVHHFGWATDPAFRYEGAMYHDRIPIHVLIMPALVSKLGQGKFVTYNVHALEFLEKIYGEYAYPQLTGLIRLEPGATEFPMMAMYGDPSEGTVSHEVGHIYSYGMLANNEWREGWMDEGLTSYQSEWRVRRTPQDFAQGAPPPPVAPVAGYRAHAHVMTPFERGRIQLYDIDLLGRADAPEPPSHGYREFATYQMAVYSRGDMMYGMLRDIIGDSAFTAFLHDYYARWKFKHVDERAMEASAERVSGRDLGWFFAQWVHHTGLVDYALSGVETRREEKDWVTRAHLARVGEFRHPMPVGAKTASGWTIVRGDAKLDEQWVEIRTAERPSDVRVDPLHSTEDWDRRNDVHAVVPAFDPRATLYTFDWPFLAQSDRDRNLAAVGPKVWYTGPGGVTGAVRVRSSYAAENGVAWDQRELGLALSSRVPIGAPGIEHLQEWVTLGNPGAPVASRSSAGATVGAWFLDGITMLEAAQNWNFSPFLYSNGANKRLRVAVDVTLPYDDRWIDSARWNPASVYDANAEYAWRSRRPGTLAARVKGFAGVYRENYSQQTHGFQRIEGDVTHTGSFGASTWLAHKLRFFAGASHNAPVQRSIGLASLDATDTYTDDFLRGRSALFARSDVNYLVPGGAGLRGYSPLLRVDRAAALNGELAADVVRAHAKSMVPAVQLVGFGDAAWGKLSGAADDRIFADAGVGILVREQLWDRRVTVRFDVPLYVRDPLLSVGDYPGGDRVKFRWTFSFADLW